MKVFILKNKGEDILNNTSYYAYPTLRKLLQWTKNTGTLAEIIEADLDPNIKNEYCHHCACTGRGAFISGSNILTYKII